MTTLGAPPLDAEPQWPLKRMRLPYIRRGAPEILATAKDTTLPTRRDPQSTPGRGAHRPRSLRAGTHRAQAAFLTSKTFNVWDSRLCSIPRRENLVVRAAERLHHLMDATYQKRSIAISSNPHPPTSTS